MKIGETTARFFSVVLQPLLMPFYSIILLFIYTRFFYIYDTYKFVIPFIVLLFTFVIPWLFIGILRFFHVVADFSLSDQKDRYLPYNITILSNIALVFYFYNSNFQIWFLGLLAVPAIVLIFGFIINFFWKISVYMLAVGGLIGSIISVCYNINHYNHFLLFMVLFILAGCLGVCRLYLKRHTPAQVYIGFLVGAFVAYYTIKLSISLSI